VDLPGAGQAAPAGATSSASSAWPPAPARSAIAGRSTQHDCSGERGARGWPNEKRAWCCLTQNVGCRLEGEGEAGEHHCEAGFGNWNESWPQSKKDWCCAVEGKPTCLFDCKAGFSNWKDGWSQAKKDWCCVWEGKPTCLFDCEEGFSKWEEDWPQAKKAWCCTNMKYPTCQADVNESDVNPEPSTGNESAVNPEPASVFSGPFDCKKELDDWDIAWSFSKVKWCCEKAQLGCTGLVPNITPQERSDHVMEPVGLQWRTWEASEDFWQSGPIRALLFIPLAVAAATLAATAVCMWGGACLQSQPAYSLPLTDHE